MAVETFTAIPDGIAALERRMADRALPLEDRENLWRIAADLARPYDPQGARASRNIWDEVIYSSQADTTVSGTSSETIMCPDFTLGANYLNAGRLLRYTLLFDVSTAITTPGTLTYRLRYGGVGGTLLAASGAYAPDPTAASTQTSAMIEWFLSMRADGASGSAFVMGRLTMTDVDDATVTTIVGNLNMAMMPVSSPAAVTINTTTANALSPTTQASVTTGSLRTRIAILEALN